MRSLLYFIVYTALAPLASCLPAAVPHTPDMPEIVRRTDISFKCDCIDHWFKLGTFWIRASSTTGCMALETIPTKLYALNALPKPEYVSNNYPVLVCSLNQKKCSWTYSPLDFLSSLTPTCEPDLGIAKYLAPILPFGKRSPTSKDAELKATLSDTEEEEALANPADGAGDTQESGEDGDTGIDDQDSDSDDDDGDSDSDEDDDNLDEGTEGQEVVEAMLW